MAISDRVTSTNDITAVSLTMSHAVTGTSDRVLWVCVSSWRSGGSSDPTGITFNSVALTKIANFLGGAANDNACSLWRLIAPAATTADIVVTHSASHDITAMGISYSGADQTTPNDTVQVNDTTSANPSHSVTSETGDRVVGFVFGWNPGAGGYTASGGLTEQLENNNVAGVNSMAVGDAPGAVTVTAAWTTTTYSDPHGQFSFNINQAPGSAPTLVFAYAGHPRQKIEGTS